MMRCFIFICLFVTFSAQLLCQSSSDNVNYKEGRDTLRLLFDKLKTSSVPSEKVSAFRRIAVALSENHPDTSITLCLQALSISESEGLKAETARTCRLLGHLYNRTSDYNTSLKYFFRALRLCEQLEKEGYGNSIQVDKCSAVSGIGVVYDNRGDFPKALEYYLAALKMAEKNNYKNVYGTNLTNIGILYYRQGEFKKALNYLNQSLEVALKSENDIDDAVVLGNIGCVYQETGEPEKALEYLFKALKIVTVRDDRRGISSNLANIGGIYHMKKEYDKAISYYEQALKIDNEIGDKTQIALDIGNIGWVYADMKKNKEAEEHLLKAIQMDRQIGSQYYESAYHEKISELYENTGRFDEALEHFKQARIIKDTLYNSEKNNELASREANYQFEKKELEARNAHEREIEMAESGKKRQTILLWAACAGVLLVMIFSLLLYKRFRIVSNQKNLIAKQKDLVETKQKEIMDSILYAKRIQNSLLPKEKLIEKNIKRLNRI